MQILDLDPALLSIHPDLDRVPMLSRLAAHFADPKIHHGDPDRLDAATEAGREWDAFTADVAANGVREPVKVVITAAASGPFTLWTLPLARPYRVEIQIVDGRHRFTAAMDAGLTSVPCIEVQPGEIESIIAGSIIGRRHFTKGARAWLAVTLHPEVATEPASKGGRPKTSDSVGGLETSDSVGGLLSQTNLAARFGISADLVGQACEIYRKIQNSPKVREAVEPSIWAGFGLGGILAGIGFVAAAESQPHKVTKDSTSLTALKSAAGFVRRLGSLTWATPIERQLFVDELAGTLGKLPAESRKALADALESAPEFVPSEKRSKPAPKPSLDDLAAWNDEQLAGELALWEPDSERALSIADEIARRKQTKSKPESLTCPLCQTPNFTQKSLRQHVCKANAGKPLSKGQVLAAITAAA